VERHRARVADLILLAAVGLRIGFWAIEKTLSGVNIETKDASCVNKLFERSRAIRKKKEPREFGSVLSLTQGAS
jgi:hypothetical protein